MRRLFTTSAMVGSSTIVQLLSGLVRVKVFAIILGPGGMGVLAQLNTFLNAAAEACSVGIYSGVTKQVARFRSQNDPAAAGRVMYFSGVVLIAVAVMLIALVTYWLDPIARYLFATTRYRYLFLFGVLAIPFMTLGNLLNTVLLAFGEVWAFTKARIAGFVLGLIPTLGLVYFMGLSGALMQVVFFQVILFGAYFYYCARRLPPEVKKLGGMSEVLGKEELRSQTILFKYGALTFATGVITNLVILFLRSEIVQNLGTEANGYYQVAFAISAYYFPFFTNGLWSHFYPRLSGLTDPAEISHEIDITVRLMVILITPVIVSLVFLRAIIIRLIFSPSFLPAADLIAPQLLGDFFLLLVFIFGCSLLAHVRLWAYLGFGILYNACYALGGWFLLPHLGVKAIPLAYAGAYIITAVGHFIYHWRSLGWTLSVENRLTLLASLALVVTTFWLSGLGLTGAVFMLVGLGIWSMVAVTRREKLKALEIVISSAVRLRRT